LIIQNLRSKQQQNQSMLDSEKAYGKGQLEILKYC